ncbi:MAG: transcriptional repressor [Betaproteobacteria bacterium]|nr:transcriptional repressor [Betaproteobacteria bacterium]
MPRLPIDQAETMIRAAGARVTRARIEMLAALLAAEHALTHHEVEKRVNRAHAIDRVTVYRVLEWLTANELAHKIAGSDRVWRFGATNKEHARQHAHFECNRCGAMICLDEPDTKPHIRLPSGFHAQEVDLLTKGLCAKCAPARRKDRRRRSVPGWT